MAGPSDEPRVALDRLSALLVEDILNASDEDILAEITERHDDPDRLATEMRVLFEKTVTSMNRQHLRTTEGHIASESMLNVAQIIPFPKSPPECQFGMPADRRRSDGPRALRAKRLPRRKLTTLTHSVPAVARSFQAYGFALLILCLAAAASTIVYEVKKISFTGPASSPLVEATSNLPVVPRISDRTEIPPLANSHNETIAQDSGVATTDDKGCEAYCAVKPIGKGVPKRTAPTRHAGPLPALMRLGFSEVYTNLSLSPLPSTVARRQDNAVPVTSYPTRRVALVVGVSNYEHAGRLANTLNDANDMAATLKRLGFDVETLLDPNRSALEAAVGRYGERSVNADVSLFYYSGHALEAAAHNWLLPATARLENERDLRFEAVDLDTVQEQTDGYAKVSIIFLDACRDNPFARRLSQGRSFAPRGLRRVGVGRGGIMVAFSTWPGEVAIDSIGEKRNSPFTAALLKYIETPGLEIRSLLTRVTKDVLEETKVRQRPWQNSSLEGNFYFSPPAAPAASSAQSLVTLDSMFWDAIKLSNNPADYKAYLTRFPKGMFIELARNHLVMLEQMNVSSPKLENPPQVPPSAAPSSSRPTGSLARAFIAVGDILSARIILRRAYQRGDALAALELGGTYDPLILRRLKVTVRDADTVQADAVQAHDWYVKAAELGSVDAIYRIMQLSLPNP